MSVLCNKSKKKRKPKRCGFLLLKFLWLVLLDINKSSILFTFATDLRLHSFLLEREGPQKHKIEKMRRRQEKMWEKVMTLKEQISFHQSRGNFSAHVQSSLILVRRCNELVLEILYGTSSPWDGAILSGLQSVPFNGSSSTPNAPLPASSLAAAGLSHSTSSTYESPVQFALKLVKVAEIEMEVEPLSSILAGGEGIPQRQAGGRTGNLPRNVNHTTNASFLSPDNDHHRENDETFVSGGVGGNLSNNVEQSQHAVGTALLKRWPVISTHSSKALIAYYSGKPRQALMCSNLSVESLCASSPSDPTKLVTMALQETHCRKIAEQVVGIIASHAVIQHTLGLDREALPFAELAVQLAKGLEDVLHGAATAQLAGLSRDLSHPSLLMDKGSVNTLLCICLINLAMISRAVTVPQDNPNKKKVVLNSSSSTSASDSRGRRNQPATPEEREICFASVKRYLLNAKQLCNNVEAAAANNNAEAGGGAQLQPQTRSPLAQVIDQEWMRTQRVFVPPIPKPVATLPATASTTAAVRNVNHIKMKKNVVVVPTLAALRETHGKIRSDKARLSMRNGGSASSVRRVVTLGSGANYAPGDDHWLSDLGL